MGPDKEIVIYEGLAHPVLCKKIRYYKDSYFTKRLLDKVEVKPLQLEGDPRMKSKAAKLVAASTLALLSACATPQVQPAGEPKQPTSVYDPFGPGSPAYEQDEAAEQALATSNARMADYWATHPPEPQKPGPAAGFPPAQKVPPIPASHFRADIIRLLESITTLDGTNRENVEAVMGVKMGRPKGTDKWFTYSGSVDEAWDYEFDVKPRSDQPNSTIRIDLSPKRSSGDRTAQCTFGTDEFFADLKATGWTFDKKFHIDGGGRRAWGFGRTHPDTKFTVAGYIYIYFPYPNPTSGQSCVSGMSINAGFLKGDA